MPDMLTIQSYFEQYPEVSWAVIGGALLIVEVFLLNTMAILFAAFGALTYATILYFGWVARDVSLYIQISWFVGLSAGWAAVLWAPLRKWSKPKKDSYDNYRGTQAVVVGEAITSSHAGQVKWSGASMRAVIRKGASVTDIPAGANVWVHGIKDAVLQIDTERPEDETSS